MRIIPLAADSLGVRSMATYVEAGSTGLLLDPGATLAPARYGLPPSQEEWEALRRANDRISAYAARAQYIFLSHYHEDHFRSDPVNYAGRIVLAKDPRRMVTGAQSRRAQALWAALDGQAVIQPADSMTLTTRDLDLAVSPPLPHGLEGTSVAVNVRNQGERNAIRRRRRRTVRRHVPDPKRRAQRRWAGVRRTLTRHPTGANVKRPSSATARRFRSAAIAIAR